MCFMSAHCIFTIIESIIPTLTTSLCKTQGFLFVRGHLQLPNIVRNDKILYELILLMKRCSHAICLSFFFADAQCDLCFFFLHGLNLAVWARTNVLPVLFTV